MLETIFIYASQVLLGLTAVAGVLKDWKDYGKVSHRPKRWIPMTVLALVVLLMTVSIILTHISRVNAAKEQQRNETKINELLSQIKNLRDDSKVDNKGFRDSLSTLSDRFAVKFSDLQSKVANAELIKEIKDAKKELRDTQRKLEQPRAKLSGSFFTEDFSKIPVLNATPEISAEGLSVDFVVANLSSVSANQGSMVLRICQGCQFAEEPAGFQRVNGAPDTEREKPFMHILPQTISEKMSAKIIPPFTANRFEVDLIVKCETCDGSHLQKMWVDVKSPRPGTPKSPKHSKKPN